MSGVKDILIATNIPGLPQQPSAVDGFERRKSTHIKPGLIVDYGYGINGATFLETQIAASNPAYTVASTSISTAGARDVPLKKITALRRASDFVLIYDGVAWNPMVQRRRISGGRHGSQFTGDRTADPAWWNTYGTTHVRSGEGHAASVPRAELPATEAQVTGTKAQMRNGPTNNHLFSTRQL